MEEVAPKGTVYPKVDFSNTEMAFRAKSKNQLLKTFWIFRMIGNTFLNYVGPKMLMLAFKLRLPIKGLVKSTLFEVFCGGETLEETAKTSFFFVQIWGTDHFGLFCGRGKKRKGI